MAGFPLAADTQTRADCERRYTPQRAQEGKDVIWAPTEDAVVLEMLEMAKVTPADKVYDLGAGDGKIVIAAAKAFGATGVGIEYDRRLVRHARCLAEAEGVEAHVTFTRGDLFEADFSDATVIALYLLPELNLRLRPALLAMKPGTRVVSYSFTMAEWEPDDFVDTDQGSAYLWIVPADVAGAWTFRPASGGDGFDVELEQRFQKLTGRGLDTRLSGHLRGAEIEFAFAENGQQTVVAGTVDGDRFTGTVVRAGAATAYAGVRTRVE